MLDILLWIIIPALIGFNLNKQTLAYIIKKMEQFWILRKLSGGVWVLFDNGEWSQCSWSDKEKGYLINPYTKGMFHINLINIVKIEDHSR